MKLTLTTALEAAAPESRTIVGKIAATEELTIDGRRIKLAADALTLPADLKTLKLVKDHDLAQPIGYTTAYDAETMTATFHLPEGDAGTQALNDAQSGLRDGLSVGMSIDRDGYTINDDGSMTVTSARVVEVSLVAVPAFHSARVSSVTASADFNLGDPMPKPETPEIFSAEQEQRISDEVNAVVRNFAASFTPQPAAPTDAQFASYGDFVKAFAANDSGARTLAAKLLDPSEQFAYKGSTMTDTNTPNTWIGDAIKLIEARRPVINTFNRETLPAQGMTMEYQKLKDNSIQVAKQEAEGDTLKYGKITLESATTPVETYGGYTTISRQVIDRSSAPYLTTTFNAMTLEYARATEAAVQAKLKALIKAEASSAVPLGKALAATSATDFVDVLIDLVAAYDDTPYAMQGLIVSADVFKRLAALETAGGDRLMGVFGSGTNQVGEISVTNLTGNLVGVPVRLLTKLDHGTIAGYDKLALTTWESPGAPFRLQDDDVTSLTRDHSVYGYLAAASQYAGALRPITVQAA